jgi:2-pyrone-4,6-dicarboxylate lactonase
VTLRGAVDTHCHVFTDPDVPSTEPVAGAAYAPPPVDVRDHALHLAASGCDGGVLVQPSAYGRDHGCLLAALRHHPAPVRGVVCVDSDSPDAELDEMHRLGVRATRLQDGYPGGVPVADLLAVGRRVADRGWHLEVWSDVRRHLDWLGDAVRRCPVPVVLDHMASLPSDVGLDHRATRLVLDLLVEGHVWVTLSGVERLWPAPVEPDARGFASAWREHEEALDRRVAAFVAARPDRLLWGSDWPHVGVTLPVPDAAGMRARVDRWLPDEELRRRVLVENPAERYAIDPVGEDRGIVGP